MKTLLNLSLRLSLVFLTACTYSINMVHTQGTATDVVDETQRADPDIQTDLTVPVSLK